MSTVFLDRDRAYNIYRHLKVIRKNRELVSRQLFNELYAKSKNADEFYEEMMTKVCQYFNKKRGGDKITFTYNQQLLKDIFQCYPKAQLIYLIRDPRAVICSMNKKSFTVFSNNFFVNLVQLKNSYKQHKCIEKYKKDYSIKVVRYEDAVDDPKTCFEGLFYFLEENSEPVLANKKREKLEQYYQALEFSDNIHEDSTSYLDKTRNMQWKEKLNNKQIWLIQYIFSSEIEGYGYKLVDLHIQKTTKIFANSTYLFFLTIIRSIELMGSIIFRRPVHFRKLSQLYFWSNNRF